MNQFSSQWKRRALSGAWKLLLILAGNTLYALAVALFVLPTGLITGGTTGLGLAAQNYFHIPLSGFVAVFNLAMFLLGLAVLGKVFALTTVISSFYYPFILEVIQRTVGGLRLTEDPLLATVLAARGITTAEAAASTFMRCCPVENQACDLLHWHRRPRGTSCDMASTRFGASRRQPQRGAKERRCARPTTS